MINLIITYVLAAIFLVFLLIFSISVIFSVLSFAPWVPTRNRDLKRIFKLADLKPGQIFYELGAGDGRLAVYAAKIYNVRAIGLEISLPFYLICKLRQLLNFNSNLKFKFKNLFKENLASADVVYFFGMPESINKRLVEKLKQELRPGTKIISYCFSLSGWTPRIIDKPGEKDLQIYLYVI